LCGSVSHRFQQVVDHNPLTSCVAVAGVEGNFN
jgi:hypothetical protein